MNIKRLFRAGSKFIVNPEYRFLILSGRGFYNQLSDGEFLEKKFKAVMGYRLDLSNPVTFNEKLQWLKLYNRKPEYTMMVDKYRVRQYIADTIGEEYLIPLLGVWEDPEEIDFDALPDQFVLKCNHNSGLGMCICKDKSKLDIKKVKRELRRGLQQDYYLTGREWPYKDVPRRIIAEKYMVDESGYELKDYKIFNFDGKPRVIEVDFDRFENHMRNLYTTDWELIQGEIEYRSNPQREFAKPECLEEMLQLASKLTAQMPHVRSDFYCINNRVYFGELTFFHGSGYEEFRPEVLGEQFGTWLKLPGWVSSSWMIASFGFTLHTIRPLTAT